MPHLFHGLHGRFRFKKNIFLLFFLASRVSQKMWSRVITLFHFFIARGKTKNSFEDFINTPKVNGYQALHTIVLMQGEEVLIRIMTPEMFQYARNGVGTFCFENNGKQRETLPWIQKLNQLVTLNTEKAWNFGMVFSLIF